MSAAGNRALTKRGKMENRYNFSEIVYYFFID